MKHKIGKRDMFNKQFNWEIHNCLSRTLYWQLDIEYDIFWKLQSNLHGYLRKNSQESIDL